MKTKLDYIFWGILLILAGSLAFAQQQGWIDILSDQFWMLAFGVAALIFFVRYLVAGWRSWGWLFPACTFTALTSLLWLERIGASEKWVAVPLIAAVVIPFLVAFAVDVRRNWWALIPAFTLSVVCMVVLFGGQLPGEAIGA